MFQRFCRSVAKDFDILMSAYGPLDFGQPAIHFIADFSWSDRIRERLHPYPPGIIYRDGVLRRVYLALANMLCRSSGRDLFAGEDEIVAVSPWVSRVMEEEFDIRCRVLESPVPDLAGLDVDPVRRRKFVCLGRIAPEKRIERVIEIVRRVRALGHDVMLHIIGECVNPSYGESIDALCKENSKWVVREGQLCGTDKAQMLKSSYFGIHACEGDAFPGAVIDMMKAGCMPWVHNSGGQPEIVDNAMLVYSDVEEAVSKIDTVLCDDDLCARLQVHVEERGKCFSVVNFKERFLRLVGEWGERRMSEGRRGRDWA